MEPDLARLDAEVTKVLRGLTARQTQATPPEEPEKWSVQQIVEHLLMSYRGSTAAVQVRIDKGRPTKTSVTLQQRMLQWMVITQGRFPHGRKAPSTMVPTLPSALRTGDELLERMRGALAEFDKVAAAGERVLGTGRVATHAPLGPLSMAQWRRFHLVHGRHHLRQIEQIREARGF